MTTHNVENPFAAFLLVHDLYRAQSSATMPRAPSQARSWIATCYANAEDPDAFRDSLCLDSIKYGIWQQERCPTTGRLHLQCYFEFRKPLRMPAVKRAIGDASAHVEPRQGSREEARDYCQKAETRTAGPWEVRRVYVFTRGICVLMNVS